VVPAFAAEHRARHCVGGGIEIVSREGEALGAHQGGESAFVDRAEVHLVADREAVRQPSGNRMIGDNPRLIGNIVAISGVGPMRAGLVVELPAKPFMPFRPIGPPRQRVVHRDCTPAAGEPRRDGLAEGRRGRAGRHRAIGESVAGHIVEQQCI
jgi:hypothetical protein